MIKLENISSDKVFLVGFMGCGNVIVSCGGGTACFNDNMKLINSMGTSVYMKLSTEDLAMRLAMDRKDRPLVAELSDNDLYTYVSLELPQREEFYYRADIILNG
jgi:shikimate kinase